MRDALCEAHWIGTRSAAQILGVSVRRVRQLAALGLLPAMHDTRGNLRFRRAQVEVIANARDARWWLERTRSQSRFL
jgi:predicted site-specific integrase-resolvase